MKSTDTNFFKNLPNPVLIESLDGEKFLQKWAATKLCINENACGDCISCKTLKAGPHPDWLDMRPPFKVEEVRNVLLKLRQKPFMSKIRMLTFLDLHEANSFVQNSLLKTFEEPFKAWVLGATVHSFSSILPTIRSRCLKWRDVESMQALPLDESDGELFAAIRDSDEKELFPLIDAAVKERAGFKQTLIKLMREASQKSYPGAWRSLAPHLEQQFQGWAMNPHPKLFWDAAWANAMNDEGKYESRPH